MKGPIVVILTFWVCLSQCAHRKMETMKGRTHFKVKSKADKELMHEVVIAVKQRNLIKLDKMLMDRSSPKSPNYQKWLTNDEISEMTANPDGAKAVLDWLNSFNLTPTWESKNLDYLKVTASIAVWEELLNTEFHTFEDTSHNEDGSVSHVKP